MSGQGAYGPTLSALRSLVRSAAGPGSRLPTERELSDRLGVNRATVRKALARLELEGIIARKVGSGTFIGEAAVPDDAAPGASPIELIEARHALEPVVAREAALRARQGDLDRLRLCLDRAESAQDFATFEEWDVALHDALSEATHNPVFVEVMRMLRKMRSTPEWNALKRSAYSLELRNRYNGEHREIFDALAGRDAAGAERAMLRHMQTVHGTIRRGLWAQPEVFPALPPGQPGAPRGPDVPAGAPAAISSSPEDRF